MFDLDNQYNSPKTQIVPEKSQIAGNLTEVMLRYLRETSPWLKLVGILGFIGCGFYILYGIIFGIASVAFTNLIGDFANIPFWLLTPLSIAGAALIFFPSRFLYNFGSKISKYQYSNSDEDLEIAFKNNKSYWKFIGILLILSFAFIPVMIVISIVGLTVANFF